MKNLRRRHFILNSMSLAGGLAAAKLLDVRLWVDARHEIPLLPDPEGVLELPKGFSYHAFSKTGELMDDDTLVPWAHDGMAAFDGGDGKVILVRNHEVNTVERGSKEELSMVKFATLPGAGLFDVGGKDALPGGGTTTLVYDTRKKALLSHYRSLAGTERNCAGGRTPWGTWISCEETLSKAGDGQHAQDHGWCFEVPAKISGGVSAGEPLKAMGRFNHEAVAVDPRSGVVYLTEDREDGAFYRFIPKQPGKLHEGGRLQALALILRSKADTRNWPINAGNTTHFDIGTPYAVKWIDLDHVESPDDDLRHRAASAGAAIFARGEGIDYHDGSIAFACTSGGDNSHGQIFRYTPSPMDGPSGDSDKQGLLQLIFEPNDTEMLNYGDNISYSPKGTLVICEDGKDGNRLLMLDREGHVHIFARNVLNDSEFAGSTFSPDGSTLFVNIQNPGFTLAITGPWAELKVTI